MRRRTVIAGALTLCLPLPAPAFSVGIFVAENGDITGPFDEAEIKKRITSKAEARQTLVWHQGMADWATADQAPALAALVAALPEETPFDFGAFVTGAWKSRDFFLKVDSRSLFGTYDLDLKSDKTFSGVVFARSVRTKTKPVQGADGELGIESSTQEFMVSNKVEGKYKTWFSEDQFFVLDLEGKVTSLIESKGPKTKKYEDSIFLKIQSDNHMRTVFDENFYRQV